MSVSCFPLNEEVLEYYVISISRRVAYQTIKVYLCGIQFFSHLHGWSSFKICDMMRLRYLLRGIRRSLGSSRIRPRRLPITIDHIGQMFSFINHNFNFHDRLMLKSAISLAFFGMLRCSEYTCASPSRFDQLFDLKFPGCTCFYSQHCVHSHQIIKNRSVQKRLCYSHQSYFQ